MDKNEKDPDRKESRSEGGRLSTHTHRLGDGSEWENQFVEERAHYNSHFADSCNGCMCSGYVRNFECWHHTREH